MKRIVRNILTILGCAAMAAACTKETGPYEGKFDHVMIFVGDSYNNLSGNIRKDLVKEMCSGQIPDKMDRNALIAFMHNTQKDYADYKTKVSPCIIRVYSDAGNPILDTVKVYPVNTVSSDANTLKAALEYVKAAYSSDSYGMVYSSHGSGWVQPQRYGNQKPAPYSGNIAQQSVGMEYDVLDVYSYEMDIKDFAKAIPMHLDYLIFDACFMGGVEAAYECRECCDRFIGSPTEILSEGLHYTTLCSQIFSKPHKLTEVCVDYMTNCGEGTIGLTDCTKLDNLAKVCSNLSEKYRNEISSVDESKVQQYYRYNKPWFFDLRDIYAKAGASEEDLATLDAALRDCILYEGHTKSFLGIPLNSCCGLSMCLPKEKLLDEGLKAQYRSLGWNKATDLLK